MAQDFDDFPVYDPVISPDGRHLSPEWLTFYGTFFTTLIGYLTSFGIFVPSMTTAQRNTIQSPVEGQMIYNTSIPAPQIWQNGGWKTFTTT